MKVAFEFTKDDIWSYGKHVTFSLPKFKRRMAINILMVPLLVCAIGYTMRFTIASYISYGILLTFFYILVLFSVLKGKVVKANSGKYGPMGKHTLEIGLNGVKENLPEREENHSWNDIKKVEQDKKYIYMYWDNMAAHVVPKRVFTKEADTAFFFSTVMNHFEKANRKEKA